MAMSATMNRRPWNSAMACPKAWRSFMYRTAWSRAPWAIPTDWAPMVGRLRSRVCMAMVNPWPSAPTLFPTGTRTSSRTISPVGLDQEAADAPVPGVGVGLGEHRVGVGDPGVRDPVLRPRQHVVVPVPHRPAPHGGDVAPGVRFRQAVARLGLPRGDPRDVPAAELLGAPVHERDHPELRDEHGDAR